jgi:hypothetical protein
MEYPSMSFYHYKEEPKILASFEAPSDKLKKFLESKIESLRVIGLATFWLNKMINGRVFANKLILPQAQALKCLLDKLSHDYRWADSKGFMVEIRVAWHIEEEFGLSVFLCMKQLDVEEQGWVMLEQVLIKRSNGLCAWWSYEE